MAGEAAAGEVAAGARIRAAIRTCGAMTARAAIRVLSWHPESVGRSVERIPWRVSCLALDGIGCTSLEQIAQTKLRAESMPMRVTTCVRRYRGFAAPLVVALCTGVLVLAQSTPKALASVLPPPESAAHFRAYIFFQPVDCSGNLEFLRVLARPKFRSSVAVIGMLAPGTAAEEAADATRRFHQLTGSNAVLASSREVDAALIPLGYRQTPFVVVVDANGQVRFATSVPSSFEASRSFERQLAELALAPAAEASGL